MYLIHFKASVYGIPSQKLLYLAVTFHFVAPRDPYVSAGDAVSELQACSFRTS